jgi:hypothetical protein
MNRKFTKCELESNKEIAYLLNLGQLQAPAILPPGKEPLIRPGQNVGGPPGAVKIWWKREKFFRLQ